MHPPEGPPVCAALNFLPPGDTAAYLLHNGAQSGAHGNFNKAGVIDFSTQREHLGALGFFRAHGGEPIRALQNNLRHVGICLHVVQNGRLCKQAPSRPGTAGGGAARRAALDAGHQSRLLTAHKGAGAQLISRSKQKSVPKIFLPKRPYSRA